MLKRFFSTVCFIFLISPVFCQVDNTDVSIVSFGNGNMSEMDVESDTRGWIQELPMFFGLNYHFKNFAIGNKSIEDFSVNGSWVNARSQIGQGDYVFVCFDDSTISDSKSAINYSTCLEEFVKIIKDKKAIPVLFTPVTNKQRGLIIDSILDDLAKRQNIALLSLGEQSHQLLSEMPSERNGMLMVHTAIKIAKIAADLLKFQVPALKVNAEQFSHSSTDPFSASVNTSADLIYLELKNEAGIDFNLRQLPVTINGWEHYRNLLRRELLKNAGIQINHTLPLDVHETGEIRMPGYVIKKIYFQTRSGVYATANLYVPDGKGPFPAVINMHGHWPGGKAGDMVQSCAHELALNGFVCLNIDAWGAGERTTIHGVEEYHGSNLGASLFNIGESLLGNMVSDNMRGVDLLCSLSYVDKNNIGATGASGGGNQTMWLSVLDERIKACMPVVNVGTFQAYIMNSNCVGELMPGGLEFCEESAILSLMAPRSIKICSALKDANPAFYPSEMTRSFENAQGVFGMYGVKDNIEYQLFNTPHGYWPEMRESMIGWFNHKLKGWPEEKFKKEIPFKLLSGTKLMVFSKGDRDSLVMSTSEYCIKKGEKLNNELYKRDSFNRLKIISGLRGILKLPVDQPGIIATYNYEPKGLWKRSIIETNRRHFIYLRYYFSGNNNSGTVIILPDEGWKGVPQEINKYIKEGKNVAVADIWGEGLSASKTARKIDGRLPKFHTLARSELWLGRTIMGDWVGDIQALINYLDTTFHHSSITVVGHKELAIAALMQSALYGNVKECILKDCPISYALDRRDGMDFYNMAVHVPGILDWGDISLITALNKDSKIVFIDPLSITGKKITNEDLIEYKNEFSKMRKLSHSENEVFFKTESSA